MPTNKLWNFRYMVGNTGRETGDAGNPHRLSDAVRMAKRTSAMTGWHVWVEHARSGRRIYDSHPVGKVEKWQGT